MVLRFKVFLLAAVNYFLDYCAYLHHSGTLNSRRNRAVWQAHLTKEYHSFEKGLALPQPRPGFRRPKALELAKELEAYLGKYGADATATVTLNVLETYQQFNHAHGAVDGELDGVLRGIRSLVRPDERIQGGGTLDLTRSEVLAAARMDFRNFAFHRHSIRDFADEAVSLAQVEEAVRIAQKTPSVCNRQPWRTHVYSEPQAIRDALAHQNGNRGIGEGGRILLVVTCELGAFEGPQERNEPFVDGGMFSMSLVYALHSMGLGTCCLNLCQQNRQAMKTRKALDIPDGEVLIMMILVGRLPGTFKAAQSCRRSLREVIVWHDSVAPSLRELSQKAGNSSLQDGGSQRDPEETHPSAERS